MSKAERGKESLEKRKLKGFPNLRKRNPKLRSAASFKRKRQELQYSEKNTLRYLFKTLTTSGSGMRGIFLLEWRII